MNDLKKIIKLEQQKGKLYWEDRALDEQIFQLVKSMLETVPISNDEASILAKKNSELYWLKAELAEKILKIDIKIYDIAKNALEKSV